MLAGLANDSINSAGSSDASAVELSAIEQQKENIQPLAAGRSAKALHALFTADRKQLHDELREGHEGFRKEIQQAEREGSDDPLDVYHRCVQITLSPLCLALQTAPPQIRPVDALFVPDRAIPRFPPGPPVGRSDSQICARGAVQV